MLAAFLHFNEDVVLVLGFTPRDLNLMARGEIPPTIDLARMASDQDCPLPSKMEIVFGLTEEHIQSSINQALRETYGEEKVTITDDPSPQDLLDAEARVSPAHEAAHSAEELAIKRARAKLS